MRPFSTAAHYQVNRMPLSAATNHVLDLPALCTGTLKATMVAVTPLHVGDGRGSFFRADGHLTIPGSSLKGAIRSLFELITWSCFPEQRHGAVHGCSSNDNGYCPACQVFGGEGYMGRLFFHPARVQDSVRTERLRVPISPQRAPTTAPGSRRRIFENRPPATGGRRQVEFLPAHTELELLIDLHNLTSEELGLLLIVLGQDPAATLSLKLGGMKAHGYGQMQVENLHVTCDAFARYTSFDSEPAGAMPDADLLACIESAKVDDQRFYQDGYAAVVNSLTVGEATEVPEQEEDISDEDQDVSAESKDIMDRLNKVWGEGDEDE